MRRDELEEKYRRLINIREQISREIVAWRGRVGENTRRREDRVNDLQAEYNGIQRRILEVDKQIRSARPTRSHTTF